ncbi:MAG: ATP-binding protein [Deltaproteobacteria bacterium]|nr:ATP-binding protein [Deltaproteobacteria bacterium]
MAHLPPYFWRASTADFGPFAIPAWSRQAAQGPKYAAPRTSRSPTYGKDSILDKSEMLSFLNAIESELPERAVLITCGLPATGKTWSATLIAERIGYELLRTDLIRRELFVDEDIFSERLASSMEKRGQVYEEMFHRAMELAGKGRGVILDATFIKQALRKRAAKIAAQNQVPFVIVHTTCPEEVSLERISRRSRENYESNAITEAAYFNNLRAFEPVDINDLRDRFPLLKLIYLVVDTSADQPKKWYILSKVIQ